MAGSGLVRRIELTHGSRTEDRVPLSIKVRRPVNEEAGICPLRAGVAFNR